MLASVVLVDSNPTTIAAAQATLRSIGCEIYSLCDIHDAPEWCSRTQPDLLLLSASSLTADISEVIGSLKSSSKTRLMPIVSFWGEAAPARNAKTEKVPVDEELGQPIWHSSSLDCIRGILALKKFVDKETEAALISTAKSLEGILYPDKVGHSQRVSGYAALLGERMGMGKSQLRALRLGAVLHDIGKIAVPASILNKPGPLTASEQAIMRKHPIAGEQICCPLKSLRSVLPIIRHHHERMDGSGYPDGLEGNAIPLEARILQTADIYDALTSQRPYRAALSSSQALWILREEAKKGWRDERLVNEMQRLGLWAIMSAKPQEPYSHSLASAAEAAEG